MVGKFYFQHLFSIVIVEDFGKVLVHSATSNNYKKQSTGQTRDNYRNQSHCGSNGRKFCISNSTNLTGVKVARKKTSAGTLAMNNMLVFQKTCQLLSLIKTDDSAPAK